MIVKINPVDHEIIGLREIIFIKKHRQNNSSVGKFVERTKESLHQSNKYCSKRADNTQSKK